MACSAGQRSPPLQIPYRLGLPTTSLEHQKIFGHRAADFPIISFKPRFDSARRRGLNTPKL